MSTESGGSWQRWSRVARAVVLRLRYPRNRVRPTTLGIYFIVMSLVVGMAAVNTGNNVLFLVFSLMLSALVISGISSRAAMRRLSMARRIPETIYAGTPFSEALTITNGKRLFPTVSLRLSSAIATGTVFLPHLPPRTTRTLVLEHQYSKRGVAEVPAVECRSHYPFGLFERKRIEPGRESVVVFPRIERIVPFFPEREGGHGDFTARLKGEGEDLYQIREYVPGESARAIDWKASSRVARIMARDFHRNANLRVTLIVDASSTSPVDHEAIETQISLAASIIDFLYHSHISYQLLSTSGDVPFGLGPLQYREALSHLALLPASDPDSGAAFRKSLSASRIHDSIPLFFSARATVRDLPVKAYRVLAAEKTSPLATSERVET